VLDPAGYTLPMRLSTEERLALRAHFSHELGADCEVLVFGSRVDDNQRGGDVDLLVRSPRLLQGRAWLAARLAARAERLLHGRRVDVLLLDPTTLIEPVHTAALATGEAL
jgi:predicted nucleotidyltransferase